MWGRSLQFATDRATGAVIGIGIFWKRYFPIPVPPRLLTKLPSFICKYFCPEVCAFWGGGGREGCSTVRACDEAIIGRDTEIRAGTGMCYRWPACSMSGISGLWQEKCAAYEVRFTSSNKPDLVISHSTGPLKCTGKYNVILALPTAKLCTVTSAIAFVLLRNCISNNSIIIVVLL